MIAEQVIVDTGPLVALLVLNDPHHEACAACSQLIRRPMVTSWAVMTEAAWLLRRDPRLSSLLQLLIDGTIACLELDAGASQWMLAYAAKYADLRPQLADLSLVYLAERERTRHIFTLDLRDFSVFRDHAGEAFRLLPE